MKQVIIYTDGACSCNPGPGGWVAILIYKSTRKTISGREEMTTNNRMELKAAIEALLALKESCQVELYTDSMYLKDGITKWIHNWVDNGWKSANRKPVKNIDLWKELDNLRNKHKIDWKWVKSHASNQLNIEVDNLARNQITK